MKKTLADHPDAHASERERRALRRRLAAHHARRILREIPGRVHRDRTERKKKR